MAWTLPSPLRPIVIGVLTLATAVAAEGQARPDSAASDSGAVTSLGELVVTATRSVQEVGRIPANVTVLTPRIMKSSAAPTMPELLRRIPGFSTRDYQMSGVTRSPRMAPSFRGLGGTSAGRTLVLMDGIPLNEPFSGWMYWQRVPLSLVERTEVVRGGGSAVWGSRALGGVINLITAAPSASRVELTAEGGGLSSLHGSALASIRSGRVGVLLSADYQDIGGFVPVPADQAGPIDTRQGGEDLGAYGKISYDATDNLQLFLAASYLDEERGYGTPLSGNTAFVADLRAGLRLATRPGGLLQIAAHGNRQDYSGLNTSVSSDRTAEQPSTEQYSVPADAVGVSMQYSQTLWGAHELTGGADVLVVDGSSNQNYRYRDGSMTRRREVHGAQRLAGVFLQDAVTLGDSWRLLASLRYDRVRNTDGTLRESDLLTSATLVDTTYASSSEDRVNASIGVRHAATGAFAWRASAYSAFRAPTLNELYNPSPITGRNTLANADLRSERLLGAELGADISSGSGLLFRLTGFINDVKDPIIEATIGTAGSTPQVIPPCGLVPAGTSCAQRANAPALRSVGVESEAEWRPAPAWSLWASYTFNPTRVSAPEQPNDGKWARGAARHYASAALSWDEPRIATIALEERYVGSRYDDDVNAIELPAFFVTDLRVNRRIGSRITATLRVENLFDAEIQVSRTSSGLVQLGGPRRVMAGVKVVW